VTHSVLDEVGRERLRQDAKWGEQNHPDGTGPDIRWLQRHTAGPRAAFLANHFRARCQANGPEADNWRDILLEEVAEAFAEDDPDHLRAELVQIAATAVQWIEAIDRRAAS